MTNGRLNTTLNTEDISALAEIFDLLAKFDFEHSRNSVEAYSSQEIKKGSSPTIGEPLLESCDKQDENSKI